MDERSGKKNILPPTVTSTDNTSAAKKRRLFEWLKNLAKAHLHLNLGSPAMAQVVKFMMVGVLNTLVDFIVYYILTRGFGFFAQRSGLAKIAAFLAGSVCSFLLNRTWTFQKKERATAAEIFKFYAAVAVSVAINVLAMQLLVSFLNMYDLVAVVVSTLITFAWNFTVSKLWVFGKKALAESAAAAQKRQRRLAMAAVVVIVAAAAIAGTVVWAAPPQTITQLAFKLASAIQQTF